ncbi:MAG: hypothetical protein RMY29_017955 [Nostoc sp. CreGUA01]|nr:hypothetical protein [Nostoc sp. CreGUA01]
MLISADANVSANILKVATKLGLDLSRVGAEILTALVRRSHESHTHMCVRQDNQPLCFNLTAEGDRLFLPSCKSETTPY